MLEENMHVNKHYCPSIKKQQQLYKGGGRVLEEDIKT